MTRIVLYGVGVDAVTSAYTLDWIDNAIKTGARRKIVTLNTTGLMLADRQPFFRDYVARADLVVADGQPLVWLAPLFRKHLPERVAGIDLVEDLAERAAARGYSIYLLGAEADTVVDAAQALQDRHPGLNIAGAHHGYLGDGAAEVAAAIKRSGASVLLVGMGSPRQEQFIEDHWDELGVNVAIGVGGTFEVLAERLSRAPRWVQRVGLEWAYRTIQEPRRLAGRYADTLLWLLVRTVRPSYSRPGTNPRADTAVPTPPAASSAP